MTDEKTVVIGIDGGGSHTRVMVSDLSGHVLSYVEGGAASLHKDPRAKENVQQAILAAISDAGCSPSQVKGLCGGIAGFDSEDDLGWVTGLTDVDGLACPKWHVNDTLVAHAGAFLGKPGIVVVSGTGSNILAITESGTPMSNYDFHHYAYSAARFLSYDAVYELLADHSDRSDEALIRQVLHYWSSPNMEEFRKVASAGFIKDQQERDKKFGRMAHLVTQAALEGSRLSQRVCDKAIHQITVGVQLLGACFESNHVQVTGIGSVVNTPYIKSSLKKRLDEDKNKSYRFMEPELSAVGGAVILAFQRLNLPLDTEVILNLRRHPSSFA